MMEDDVTKATAEGREGGEEEVVGDGPDKRIKA